MGTTTQLLDLQLAGGGDGLARVLTVLRRRRCRVTSVDFAAGDRHYGGRLVIGVAAPSAHAHCVAAWLENVVEVRAVRLERPPAGSAEDEVAVPELVEAVAGGVSGLV
jgi:acetolactate synthase regulatory subunit